MDKAADAWLGRIPNLLTLAVALHADERDRATIRRVKLADGYGGER